MRIGKIGVAVIGLVPFNAYAECTPTPDCASIGYTETSCETDYLACPFDSTKLKCIPCDSSFRYDCTGENITGGTGAACGGKYVSCACSDSESTFKNGKCIGPKCPVGYIYYADKSCSSELNNSKTPIGVFVKSDTLVVSNIRSSGMQWGTVGTDIPDLVNQTNHEAKIDYNGKSNTAILVAFQTAEGKTASNSAAISCNEYSTVGTNVGDWYLPAAGEIYSYLYGGGTNYNKINTTMTTLGWTFEYKYFWSSSESNSSSVWLVGNFDDTMFSSDKSNAKSVVCFLAL